MKNKLQPFSHKDIFIDCMQKKGNIIMLFEYIQASRENMMKRM